MALERGKLSNVVRVAAGATVGIATCTSGKKVYIKSIIAHAAGTGINTATGQVYFTQAGVTTGPIQQSFLFQQRVYLRSPPIQSDMMVLIE